LNYSKPKVLNISTFKNRLCQKLRSRVGSVIDVSMNGRRRRRRRQADIFFQKYAQNVIILIGIRIG